MFSLEDLKALRFHSQQESLLHMAPTAEAAVRTAFWVWLSWSGAMVPARPDSPDRPPWWPRSRRLKEQEEQRAQAHFTAELRRHSADVEFWREFWGTPDGLPPEDEVAP